MEPLASWSLLLHPSLDPPAFQRAAWAAPPPLCPAEVSPTQAALGLEHSQGLGHAQIWHVPCLVLLFDHAPGDALEGCQGLSGRHVWHVDQLLVQWEV